MSILNSHIINSGAQRGGLIQVIKLELFETGTYQDPVVRTFETSVDSNNLADLQRSLHDSSARGNNVSAAALGGIAGTIMRPSSRIESVASIAGGWQSKRFRFILEIDLTNGRSRSSRRKVLTGWTNYDGVDHNGQLDPNMIFHVNNNIELRDSVSERMGLSTQMSTNVSQNNQLLVGKPQSRTRDLWRGNGADTSYSLRPTDLMTTIGTKFSLGSLGGFDGMSAGAFDEPHGYSQDEIINNDSNFSMGICNSTRDNLNPSTYLSRLLTGVRSANKLGENDYADEESLLYDRAAGMCSETGTDDVVFNAFANLCEFKDTGEFTAAQLMRADPEVDDKTYVGRVGGVHKVFDNAVAQNTSEWTGADIATEIATMVKNAIPGMLIADSIAVAVIDFTNMTQTGQDETSVAIRGMMHEGMDEYSLEEKIAIRFNTELAASITKNGNLPVSIHVECDVYEDTLIVVAIDNERPVEFIDPTLADSTAPPVITGNKVALDNMASDMINITQNIESFGGNSPTRTYVSTNTRRW